jgi:PPIC-type PPIASE domain/SurA N-terminal domain
MERFPWRFAVYLLVGLYLFADMVIWRGPVHQRLTKPWGNDGEAAVNGEAVAMVYGKPITKLELSEAIRAYLWRRGETWEELGDGAKKMSRSVVLEQLINDRLVRAFRVMNGLDGAVPETVVEREVEMMRRQFPEEGEWETRLKGQVLTEAEFEEEARESLADEAWIEEKIRHRLVEVTDIVVREWYEAHSEEMKVPERYRVRHLFLTAHDPEKRDRSAEVAAMSVRLVGMDEAGFAKVVAESSEDERTKLRGGDLGWFTAERMPEDFVEAVRAAANGGATDGVKTELGWHWFRGVERVAERVPVFDEVKEEIRAMLEGERRAMAVKALMGELRVRSVKPTRFLWVYGETE